MRCLIVGDGPSKSLLNKCNMSNIDIFCIHYHQPSLPTPKAIISLDLTQYDKKEKIAIDKGLKVILSDNSCYGDFKQHLKDKNVEFYKPQKMVGNSGAFAIEWAIAQGYKEIYTAGLDFYCDEGEYISITLLKSINNYLEEMMNKGILIYKLSMSSKLECPIKYF